MSCLTDEPDAGVVVEFADSRVQRALEALALLAGAEIESMNRADLDAVVKARRDVISFADAVEIRIARRSRQLAAEGRSEPAADVLREQGRRSSREAAAAAGRELACEQLRSFESALGDGTVSSGHLDVLANATTRLDDAARAEFVGFESALLADACRSSVDEFERHCRDLTRQIVADDGSSELERQRRANRIKHWIDKVTGMGHLHAELDPESHARVLAAVNARLRTLRRQQRHNPATTGNDPAASSDGAASMSYDQLEAQAFVDVVTGSTTLDRRVADVVVMIDFETLRDGNHPRTVCETSDATALPPSTVRRLCCEANIIPAVLDGDGVPLDLGRSQRLASPAQRQAILTMYRTCGFPGCTTGVDRCEVHHTEQWLSDNGPTDLDKLVPLCCNHHHLAHEGGWTLTLGEQRHITVHRPDGVRYFTGTTTDRQHREQAEPRGKPAATLA